MSDLIRMSCTIEQPLFEKLEAMVVESGYTNRSEFLRDMIRERVAHRADKRNEVMVGAIMLVYKHDVRELNKKLVDLQHDYHKAVLANTHVHLDHHICAEVIIVKAKAGVIRSLADLLRRQKGVLHASLSLGSTGKVLA